MWLVIACRLDQPKFGVADNPSPALSAENNDTPLSTPTGYAMGTALKHS